MVYELLESLGAKVGDTIHATGGAAGSLLGLQIRANLLDKRMCVPSHPNSAMGAAILAAVGYFERPVGELSREMVTMVRTIEPTPSAYYRERLGEFRELCEKNLISSCH